MTDTKNPITSVAVWGGLMALVMGILSLCGVGNTPENQQTVAQIIVAITEIVAGVMAIVGRWRATKQISIKAAQKP